MLLRLPVQGIQELHGRVLGLLTVQFTLYDILFFFTVGFLPIGFFGLKQHIARQGHLSGGYHAVF
jgi:hypothetical protein